jgi:predicted nuclease with TOPRIM domain
LTDLTNSNGVTDLESNESILSLQTTVQTTEENVETLRVAVAMTEDTLNHSMFVSVEDAKATVYALSKENDDLKVALDAVELDIVSIKQQIEDMKDESSARRDTLRLKCQSVEDHSSIEVIEPSVELETTSSVPAVITRDQNRIERDLQARMLQDLNEHRRNVLHENSVLSGRLDEMNMEIQQQNEEIAELFSQRMKLQEMLCNTQYLMQTSFETVANEVFF